MNQDQFTLEIGKENSFQRDTEGDIKEISGLVYEPKFLNEGECHDLLREIDSQTWMRDLQRRVQHYGWRYDYSARFVSEELRIGPLPDWILIFAERLHQMEWFDRIPDQVIVNEYEPGQGIALHTDRDCFGPVVATISLGDKWPMEFVPSGTSRGNAPIKSLSLEVGSVLVMMGEARSKWMHGIRKRKSDGRGAAKRARSRRVSVTFRTVQIESVQNY